jgi:hypothetical protein
VLAQVNLTSIGPNSSGDGYGHGTFVAGIAAGSASGYAGAMPNANLVSIDVLRPERASPGATLRGPDAAWASAARGSVAWSDAAWSDVAWSDRAWSDGAWSDAAWADSSVQ